MGLTGEEKKTYQRGYMKEYQRKQRSKQVGLNNSPIIDGSKQIPDIIDKLTDKVWRGKLERICAAFKGSHNPHYVHDVWMGKINLSTVCELVECTR